MEPQEAYLVIPGNSNEDAECFNTLFTSLLSLGFKIFFMSASYGFILSVTRGSTLFDMQLLRHVVK
jgi:hypothetical protein